ncbi:MAG: hypothetical protein IKL36_05655, partial [Clostridia bacterium]|nr:hypothetical protein [Clostridia bacterium]
MNVSFKNFKRCVSLLLVVAMLLSTANLSIIMTSAADDHVHQITLGQIMAENYDAITEAEKEILASGKINGDVLIEYTHTPEEIKDSHGLVTVDNVNREVTVKNYVDGSGNTWIPVTFDIVVGSDVKEDNNALTTSTEDESLKLGSYAYGENEFSVVVTYALDTAHIADPSQVVAAVQLKLLNAAGLLAEDIQYMDLLNKDVCYTTTIKGQTFSLTPVGITDILTTPLPLEQLEGGTLVDMLYKYFVGSEKLDDIEAELPNGDYIELDLTLTKTYRDYISDSKNEDGLLEQQNAGGLLLSKFFKSHSAMSVLEMIADADAYAELYAALALNYEQFDGLSKQFSGMYVEMNNALGIVDNYYATEKPYEQISAELDAQLPDVIKTAIGYNGVEDLADVQALEEAINDYVEAQKVYIANLLSTTIADKLPADSEIVVPTTPEEITSASLEQLSADIKKIRDDKLGDLTTLIAEADAEYGLGAYGVTVKEFKTAADVAQLQTELTNAKTQICTMIQSVIAFSGYADQLVANGGTATITGAADIEKNIVALGKVKESIFTGVTDTIAPYATDLNKLGVTTTTVASEDDLNALIAEINTLEANLPGMIADAEALLAEKLGVANEAVESNLSTLPMGAGTTIINKLKEEGCYPIETSADIDAMVNFLDTYSTGNSMIDGMISSYVASLKETVNEQKANLVLAEEAIAALKDLRDNKMAVIKSGLAEAKTGVATINSYISQLTDAKKGIVAIDS